MHQNIDPSYIFSGVGPWRGETKRRSLRTAPRRYWWGWAWGLLRSHARWREAVPGKVHKPHGLMTDKGASFSKYSFINWNSKGEVETNIFPCNHALYWYFSKSFLRMEIYITFYIFVMCHLSLPVIPYSQLNFLDCIWSSDVLCVGLLFSNYIALGCDWSSGGCRRGAGNFEHRKNCIVTLSVFTAPKRCEINALSSDSVYHEFFTI